MLGKGFQESSRVCWKASGCNQRGAARYNGCHSLVWDGDQWLNNGAQWFRVCFCFCSHPHHNLPILLLHMCFFFSKSSILCRQGITQGVKSSTRAIRVAEDRLRRLTNTNPGFSHPSKKTLFPLYGPWRLTPFLTSSVASMQEGMHQSKTEETEPMVAKSARRLKEGIVKGRSLWQLFFTITRFSKIATSYLGKRAKQ